MSVVFGLYEGAVEWQASATFLSGTPFQIFGVTLRAGSQHDFVPVAIYGPAANVTLPGSVTRTNANTAVGHGGTRAAVLGTITALPSVSDLAVAEIKDNKVGAANGRDLFLFGRAFVAQTLFRSVGRVLDDTSRLSQSLLMDGDGRGYLRVDASAGLTAGDLVQCVRGRTGTWRAAYASGGAPALADADADAVIIYGVAPVSVTAKAGAVGRLQVVGWVRADLHAAVSLAGGNVGLKWRSGAGDLEGGDLRDSRVFAAATSGALRNRSIFLLGRIFNN